MGTGKGTGKSLCTRVCQNDPLENYLLVSPLVGNCSATRYSVAAPRPGARQGFGGPMHPRHPRAVAERGATGAFQQDTKEYLNQRGTKIGVFPGVKKGGKGGGEEGRSGGKVSRA